MANISSPGIGSGLDIKSIVSQLTEVERMPLKKMQSAASTIQTRISSFGQMQSLLSTFKDAASALSNPSSWNVVTATSSNPTVMSATATGGSVTGSYTVTVNKLAASQTVASSAAPPFADSTAVVGQGDITIGLGSWASGSFVADPTRLPVTISVGAGADSLAAVRDRINAANAGVSASIVQDFNGARLVLRSTQTGSANGFQIDTTGSLGALAYNGAGSAMTQTQPAENAEVTINNLPVTSASNTLTSAIDGVTLKLSQVTTAPVDITVAQDTDAIAKSVQTFADAYSALAKYISTQSAYDATSKIGGPLQGDFTTRTTQNQLRSVFAQVSGASSVYTQISQIGLSVQTDGSLKLDTGKLKTALGNTGEVRKLLAASDAVLPEDNGFAKRMQTLATRMLDSDGSLTTRSQGLKRQLQSNQQSQDKLAARVEQFQKRITDQYNRLDSQLGKLNGLSNYVTQQMNLLNKTSA